jgi:hypothetical protein
MNKLPIALILFLVVALSGTVLLRVLNNNIGNGETWRILFATIGFLLLSFVGVLFIARLGK